MGYFIIWMVLAALTADSDSLILPAICAVMAIVTFIAEEVVRSYVEMDESRPAGNRRL